MKYIYVLAATLAGQAIGQAIATPVRDITREELEELGLMTPDVLGGVLHLNDKGIDKLCERMKVDCANFRSKCVPEGSQGVYSFEKCIDEFPGRHNTPEPDSASQANEAPASQADAQAIDNPPSISTPEFNQLGLSDDGIAGHQFNTANVQRFNKLCEMMKVDCAPFRPQCIKEQYVISFEECIRKYSGPESTPGPNSASQVEETSASQATSQANEAQPIWAENLKEFNDCSVKLPNDPCVRELFHLQGSLDRFRWNCKQGDLSIDRQHNINLGYFPQDKFPDGPKCGTRNGRVIAIKPESYDKVCKQCFD
ncbi:hypothetical protein G6O67_006111 [Ophiocordyceps sinensis]|uniref:Uncharacterized protein n=1 Tax=Ophiocordyceps sinensis TaxID=72228 RepID=A0A8H4LUU7_9HYPO|nr:hypothetical protein G6O67_006111 [Ophiocordyceps sinensis]